jgi:hypothetical protein
MEREDHTEMRCLAIAIRAEHAMPVAMASPLGLLALADAGGFVGMLV